MWAQSRSQYVCVWLRKDMVNSLALRLSLDLTAAGAVAGFSSPSLPPSVVWALTREMQCGHKTEVRLRICACGRIENRIAHIEIGVETWGQSRGENACGCMRKIEEETNESG